ncbi:MAG TPA: hypothetical protein PLF96_10375 [Thermotogota bacterium]|nr:hypothetical protein [Thermotogota bacterium]
MTRKGISSKPWFQPLWKSRTRLAFQSWSLLLLVLLVFWVLLTAIGLPKGTLSEQLHSLHQDPVLYRVSFANAFLIFLPVTAILWLLTGLEGEPGPLQKLGLQFLMPYATLVSLAYASQFSLLFHFSPDDPLAQAWYFYNPASMAYFFDLLGYLFCGIACVLVGFPLLEKQGKWKWIGIFLLASGLLNGIGFLGFAVGSKLLEQGVTVGGVLWLPIALLGFLSARNQGSSA